MNKVKFVLFVAGVSLALGFALSCSGDDGKNSGLKECDAVFNPDNKFCYDGVVYDKCDGMTYNPTSHICENGVAIPAKCENGLSNTDTYYCSGTIKMRYGSLKYGGQTYKTVVIGEQTWMAENLNYNATGSKCYKDSTAYCEKYGRLYNWETAMKACPSSGWHLPSDAEWTKLIDFVGGSNIAGTKLKAISFRGTDNFGFAALPGGAGISGGNFSNVGNYGYWFSATEDGANNAFNRSIQFAYESVGRNGGLKDLLLSVRCLKD